MNNTSSFLAECGESLFGTKWRVDLAQALDVSERTVRRWVAGSSPVPDDVWTEIGALLSDRAKRLRDLSIAIKQLPKPVPDQPR